MKQPALKRIYDPASPADGARVLVDRLWPRGIAKARAQIDLWLKDIAPSDALRRRFHAKPEKWDDFCAAYFKELERPDAQAAAKELRSLQRKGAVTLLYAARDQERNNAAALRLWLKKRTRK
ncbi:MAG: DUF488 family protein [Alphaproteobacteria bacterium]|nr:DUF488 family protein [Alphaproteobacteria bacterium]